MPTLQIPTRDFFEFLDIQDEIDREEALERFISAIETGYFLEWDLVRRYENGAELNAEEKKLIQTWLSLNTDSSGRILYIEDTARPLQHWYEIAQVLVPHMLREPFYTRDALEYWASNEGWSTLTEVISVYGQQLPLPPHAKTPLEVFPATLMHRLNVQSCFSELSGLGYEAHLTLHNPEEQERIEWFIRQLKLHKSSLDYLQLNLAGLLSLLILPEADEKIFVELFTQRLSLPSRSSALADFL